MLGRSEYHCHESICDSPAKESCLSRLCLMYARPFFCPITTLSVNLVLYHMSVLPRRVPRRSHMHAHLFQIPSVPHAILDHAYHRLPHSLTQPLPLPHLPPPLYPASPSPSSHSSKYSSQSHTTASPALSPLRAPPRAQCPRAKPRVSHTHQSNAALSRARCCTRRAHAGTRGRLAGNSCLWD